MPLQVSAEEFEWLRRRNVAGLTQKAAEYLAQAERKPVALPVLWEKEVGQAIQFYETAYLRDHALRSKLLADFHDPKAALVYGGFHAERIKQILREAGIGYVVITPTMQGESKAHQIRYQKLMRGEKYDFEMKKAAQFSRPLCVYSELEPSELPSLFNAAGISSPMLVARKQRSESRVVHEEALDGFLDDKDQRTALFYSTQVNEADRYLLSKSKNRSRKYVRISLRSRADLSRLLSDLKTATEGKLESVSGELVDVLTNGGVLLIDYANSNSSLAEEFNSLFDKNSYFQEMKQISPQLKIIGMMRPEQSRRYTNALQSRYARAQLLEFQAAPQDPLDEIIQKVNQEEDLPKDAVVIDLAEGDPFDSSLPLPLISGVEIDAHGLMKIAAGVIVKAVKEGKPLVIRRGKFEADSALMRFLTRAAVLGFRVDGVTYSLPRKIFVIQESSPDDQKVAAQKKLIALEETAYESSENVWVIHGANVSSLFHREQIDSRGNIVALSPLLNLSGVRIRVTGNLPLSAWHRLMASPRISQIEVDARVRIPGTYRKQRSPKLVKAVGKDLSLPQTWADVSKSEKVIYVETSDPALTQESFKQKFPGETPVPIDVNPDKAASDLLGEIKEDGPGHYRHTGEQAEMLNALREGKTVFLTGLESNLALAEDLATLTAPEPYLVVNGERLFLKNLPGRMVIAFHPSMKKNRPIRKIAEDTTVERQRAILMKEFPGILTDESWEQINKLREELAKSFPDVALNWSLNRLRLILRQAERLGDWNAALQDLIGNHFFEHPQKRAFVRLLIRHIFKAEEAGRRSNTVAWERIREIMERKTIAPLTWNDFGWQIADSMSLDLIQKIWSNGIPVFQNGAGETAFKVVRSAIEGKEPDAPGLDRDFEKNVDVQDRQLQKTFQVLRDERAAMIIGVPGVGKTYSADRLAEMLGYSNEQVIKLTVGAGMKVKDLFGDKKRQRKGLDDWKNLPDGGLLLVDEANLTDPEFWNFLRSFFSDPALKNHRILFTGNPYSMPGRRFQKFLEEFVVTIPYEAFPSQFLREQVRKNLDPSTPQREEVAELIYKIYEAVGNVPGINTELSLRDLNDLTERINTLLEPQNRTREEVLWIAWRKFRGMLSLEQREALRLYLHSTLGGRSLDWIEMREAFPQGETFKDITMTESTGRFLNSVVDSLKMRESHIQKATQARADGQAYENKGKSGLIAEGSSGRLKSEGIVAVLESEGFIEAEKAPEGWPANKKYYRLVASVGSAEQLIDQIRRAQREGAIVVIDELNLLPASFLEGILNDVLTGAAEPGFFLFASMNSSDFEGRQKLSSALQNRVVYQRLEPYSEEELTRIAMTDLKGSKETESSAKLIARFHVWLRENIQDASRHPTPRELRAAAKLVALGKTFEEAIESVYGTRFLELMPPGGSKEIPSRETLEKFKPKLAQDLLKTIQIFAAMFFPSEMKLPKIEAIQSATANGTRNSQTHTIQMNINALNDDRASEWLETLLHEISHGLFTTGHGLQGAANGIWQDLEDIRHQRAFELLFPEGKLRNNELRGRLSGASTGEQLFAEMIQSKNYEALRSLVANTSASPRQIFQLVLMVSARELVTNEQLTEFIAGLQAGAADILSLFPVNPFTEALPFIQAARNYVGFVPKKDATRSEIENMFNQAVAQLEGVESAASKFSYKPVFEREDGRANLPLERNSAAYYQKTVNFHDLIAKSREKRIEKLRAQLKEMEEEVLYETEERIQEIKEQLTDPNHLYSLLPEMNLLKDAGLDRLRKRILDFIQLLEVPEKSTAEDAFAGRPRVRSAYHGGLSRLGADGVSGMGSRGNSASSDSRQKQPKGARYKGAQHGVHGDQAKEQPPVIVEATAVVSENVSISAADITVSPREAVLESVTRQPETEEAFLTVLEKLFVDQNLPEGDFGPSGEFTVAEFIHSRRMEMSHYRLADSEENLMPRPFVLTLGDIAAMRLNPLTIEFFHYLFERGFSISVYLDAGRRQTEIRDFKTLSAVLGAARQIPEADILKDYQNRGEVAPPIYSIQKLQAMVESVYLAGVLRKASRGEKVALAPDDSKAQAAHKEKALKEELENRRARIEAEILAQYQSSQLTLPANFFKVIVEDGKVVLEILQGTLNHFQLIESIKGVDVFRVTGNLQEGILEVIDQKVIGQFRKSIKALELVPDKEIVYVSDIPQNLFEGFEALEAILMGNFHVSYGEWDNLAPSVKANIRKLAFRVGFKSGERAFSGFSHLEDLTLEGANFLSILGEAHEFHGIDGAVQPNIKRLRISSENPRAGIKGSFDGAGLTGLEALELDFPNALTLQDLAEIPQPLRHKIKKLAILNNKKMNNWNDVSRLFPNVVEWDFAGSDLDKVVKDSADFFEVENIPDAQGQPTSKWKKKATTSALAVTELSVEQERELLMDALKRGGVTVGWNDGAATVGEDYGHGFTLSLPEISEGQVAIFFKNLQQALTENGVAHLKHVKILILTGRVAQFLNSSDWLAFPNLKTIDVRGNPHLDILSIPILPQLKAFQYFDRTTYSEGELAHLAKFESLEEVGVQSLSDAYEGKRAGKELFSDQQTNLFKDIYIGLSKTEHRFKLRVDVPGRSLPFSWSDFEVEQQREIERRVTEKKLLKEKQGGATQPSLDARVQAIRDAIQKLNIPYFNKEKLERYVYHRDGKIHANFFDVGLEDSSSWDKIFLALQGVEVLNLSYTSGYYRKEQARLKPGYVETTTDWYALRHLTSLEKLFLTASGADESVFEQSLEGDGFVLVGVDDIEKPGKWKVKQTAAPKMSDKEFEAAVESVGMGRKLQTDSAGRLFMENFTLNDWEKFFKAPTFPAMELINVGKGSFMSDEVLRGLAQKYPRIKALVLTLNEGYVVGANTLRHFKSIENFQLRGQLSQSAVDELVASHQELKELVLEGGPLVTDFAFLGKLLHLKTVMLRGSLVNEQAMARLAALQNLEYVHLYREFFDVRPFLRAAGPGERGFEVHLSELKGGAGVEIRRNQRFILPNTPKVDAEAKPFNLENLDELFAFLKKMDPHFLELGLAYDKAIEMLKKEGFEDFIAKFKKEYKERTGQDVPTQKRSEFRAARVAVNLRQHQILSDQLERLKDMNGLIVIDSDVLAGLSSAQLEECEKILAQSPKLKLWIVGESVEKPQIATPSSRTRDDKRFQANDAILMKNFSGQIERVSSAHQTQLDVFEKVILLGKAENAKQYEFLNRARTQNPIVRMRYESEKEVGLPTLGLLLPKENLPEPDQNGFLTLAHFRSEFRAIALALLTSFVVARAA